MAYDGPLPRWTMIGGYTPDCYFQATDPDGILWRLWLDMEPAEGDPLPPGYRLAPEEARDMPFWVTREHGLYYALDTAGLHIAKEAVRADPEGARRQMGLDTEEN